MTTDAGEKRRTALLDSLARMLEQVGFPHTVARVYAALTLAEGEGMSTSELVEQLHTSKASVSNATQFLVGFELVQKYRVPGSRQTHYRVLKGVWGGVLVKKFAAMGAIRQTVEEALEFVDSPLARERLEEMQDVYGFFELEIDKMIERFNERTGR